MMQQVYTEVLKEELRKFAKERGGTIYICEGCGRMIILYLEAPLPRAEITCLKCNGPKLYVKETER